MCNHCNLRHNQKKSAIQSWTSFIINLSMGLIYIMVGISIWFIPSIASSWDSNFKGIFSGICLLYGFFRIYRAYLNFLEAKSH